MQMVLGEFSKDLLCRIIRRVMKVVNTLPAVRPSWLVNFKKGHIPPNISFSRPGQKWSVDQGKYITADQLVFAKKLALSPARTNLLTNGLLSTQTISGVHGTLTVNTPEISPHGYPSALLQKLNAAATTTYLRYSYPNIGVSKRYTISFFVKSTKVNRWAEIRWLDGGYNVAGVVTVNLTTGEWDNYPASRNIDGVCSNRVLPNGWLYVCVTVTSGSMSPNYSEPFDINFSNVTPSEFVDGDGVYFSDFCLAEGEGFIDPITTTTSSVTMLGEVINLPWVNRGYAVIVHDRYARDRFVTLSTGQRVLIAAQSTQTILHSTDQELAVYWQGIKRQSLASIPFGARFISLSVSERLEIERIYYYNSQQLIEHLDNVAEL